MGIILQANKHQISKNKMLPQHIRQQVKHRHTTNPTKMTTSFHHHSLTEHTPRQKKQTAFNNYKYTTHQNTQNIRITQLTHYIFGKIVWQMNIWVYNDGLLSSQQEKRGRIQ